MLGSIISIFLGMTVLDMMWAVYITSVTKKNKSVAFVTAGLLFLINSTVTVEYVHEPSLKYAGAAGAAFGTLLILHFNSHKDVILCTVKKLILEITPSWLQNTKLLQQLLERLTPQHLRNSSSVKD